MAEQKPSIFSKQATERLRSPDDLDKYVRVTSPSVWVVLLAAFVLVAGLFAWGVFGSVSTSVTATGTCVEGRVFCLLDAEQAARVKDGDDAYVGGRAASVTSVASVPLSREEASELLPGDYLVETLMPGEWGYLVTFKVNGDLVEGVPLTASITTERVPPISLVMG